MKRILSISLLAAALALGACSDDEGPYTKAEKAAVTEVASSGKFLYVSDERLPNLEEAGIAKLGRQAVNPETGRMAYLYNINVAKAKELKLD